MKRFLPLPLILLLAFSGCTRQQQMNADMFLTALGDGLDIAVDTDSILYENETATVYLVNGETALLIRAAAADKSLQRVGRISLTAPCTAEGYALLRRAFAVTVPLFAGDSAEAITEQLQLPDTLPNRLAVNRCQTQFYRYACYLTPEGFSLTAECIADYPETGQKNTLSRKGQG